MKQKWFFCLSIVLAFIVLLGLSAPVRANPVQPQVVYQTPTAMPDGRILYKVKENDTCISISLLNKISLDDLRKLNSLQGEDCFLTVGQELLLGVVEPAAAPAATPSPTPLLPVTTPFNGKGKLCVSLFDDLNGDGISEDSEISIGGGAASINDRAGKFSQTGLTTESEKVLCFEDVPAGEYTISMAVPDGYNATTTLTYNLKMAPGDSINIDFGAQLSSAAAPLPPSEGGRSPMLGILGGVLVLAGAGLGIYLKLMRR